jgi:integration host factor subunit beta
MNKLELIKMLKNEHSLTNKDAAAVVELFFDSILCSFYVKEYKSYRGRNPKTGESVYVAPKKLPFFKCGKELKERVDN